MLKRKRNYLKRRALRVPQKAGRDIFLLTLSGSELLELAGISRIGRSDHGNLIGYQRPEVRRHVRDIASYFDSNEMLLAHPIILSFTSSVSFVSSRGPKTTDGLAIAGTLSIPIPTNEKDKPAWIVDGQQRALAISLCQDQSFAVPICAFVADDIQIQRDQFLRINNSRPLPKGLVTELLPEISSPLPPNLAIRKIPSLLCDLLNTQPHSPFFQLVKRPSLSATERKAAVVTDTVLIKTIEESLTNPTGCLFPYRNLATGQYDQEGIWAVLTTYWTAVKRTFPNAWARSPVQSRLMHGVGLRAMGKLMDRIMTVVDVRSNQALEMTCRELRLIQPICRWTDGEWEALEGVPWNSIQNVPSHIATLSNALVRKYLEARAGLNRK